jgi:hypothetical protein
MVLSEMMVTIDSIVSGGNLITDEYDTAPSSTDPSTHGCIFGKTSFVSFSFFFESFTDGCGTTVSPRSGALPKAGQVPSLREVSSWASRSY